MAAVLSSCSSLNQPKPTEAEPKNVQPEPQLKLISSKGELQSLTLEQLKKELEIKTLTVDSNPAYKGAPKHYEGFDLLAIVKKMEPSLKLPKKSFWLEVTTLDGWKAPAYSSKTLVAGKALLAVRETQPVAPMTEDGLWTLVVTPKKTLSPGPFYLVWNDKGRNPDVMPLQIASIRVLLKKPKK